MVFYITIPKSSTILSIIKNSTINSFTNKVPTFSNNSNNLKVPKASSYKTILFIKTFIKYITILILATNSENKLSSVSISL